MLFCYNWTNAIAIYHTPPSTVCGFPIPEKRDVTVDDGFLPLITNIFRPNRSPVTGHVSQWTEVPFDVLESHESLPERWDSERCNYGKTGALGHLDEGWGDPPNNGAGGVGWNLPHLINTNPFPGGMVMRFRENAIAVSAYDMPWWSRLFLLLLFWFTRRGGHRNGTVHCVTHLCSGYSRKVLLLTGAVPVDAPEGEARSSPDLIRCYQLCEQVIELCRDVTVAHPPAVPSHWCVTTTAKNVLGRRQLLYLSSFFLVHNNSTNTFLLHTKKSRQRIC